MGTKKKKKEAKRNLRTQKSAQNLGRSVISERDAATKELKKQIENPETTKINKLKKRAQYMERVVNLGRIVHTVKMEKKQRKRLTSCASFKRIVSLEKIASFCMKKICQHLKTKLRQKTGR